MRERFLPFAQPLIGEEEIELVVSCLRSGWLTTGQKVRQLEEEFAPFAGAKHAIAVNSCTAALHLSLEAIGIGPGDEVIVPTMTFTATGAVVEHLGGTPVLADVDDATLNLDPMDAARRVTARTRAIIPVHYGGQACDMDPLLELAKRHDLKLVEDAAHAIPTLYKGRVVGSIGDATCFSFYATKNLTTGEGGMLTTDDDAIADRARLMCLHGMSRDAWKRYTQKGSWMYEILAPGFKYNLTDIAAAIGLPQLKHCRSFHERRLEIARRYHDAFAGLPGIIRPGVRDEREHAWHLYVIRVDSSALSIDRDEFIRQLAARNIGTSVHFIPLHVHPYWRERYRLRAEDFPRATAAFHQILSLPIYARMNDEDVADVIAAVTEIARCHRR